MAIPSEGWYGVPHGLVFSFPCRISEEGLVQVVDLLIDDAIQAGIDRNVAALQDEAVAVASLCKQKHPWHPTPTTVSSTTIANAPVAVVAGGAGDTPALV